MPFVPPPPLLRGGKKRKENVVLSWHREYFEVLESNLKVFYNPLVSLVLENGCCIRGP